jgi:GTP-binding protein HflX
VGSGKLAEICQLIEVQNINYLVVDDDLTPRQQKTIEEYINGRRPGREPVTLLDRTAIILEIFSRHARL